MLQTFHRVVCLEGDAENQKHSKQNLTVSCDCERRLVSEWHAVARKDWRSQTGQGQYKAHRIN